jgi:hypothetical protein
MLTKKTPPQLTENQKQRRYISYKTYLRCTSSSFTILLTIAYIVKPLIECILSLREIFLR